MDMKRFFLFAIAIAALTLAGCGGNGGGGMVDSDAGSDATDRIPTVTCPDGSMAATLAPRPAGPMAEEMALEDARDYAMMAAYMMAMAATRTAPRTTWPWGKAHEVRGHGQGRVNDSGGSRPRLRRWPKSTRRKTEMYRDQAQDSGHDARPGNHQCWRTRSSTCSSDIENAVA